jgi:ABC-type transport system involved in multi-copper enzyme maturation permease subunit
MTTVRVPWHESTVERPWALWGRQVAALVRTEWRRNLFSKRYIAFNIVPSIPIVVGLVVLFAPLPLEGAAARDALFSRVFQTFIMRVVLFFGCFGLFAELFRGEVLDRTLHYAFLVPIRREVLLAGKFTAGLVASTLVFCASVLACAVLVFLPLGGEGLGFLFSGTGLWHLLVDLCIVACACASYGAFFLFIGLVVKNTGFPAILLFWWETLNVLLPPALKVFSVTWWLQGLCPTQFLDGPFAVAADPPSVPVALLVLTAQVAGFLALAAWRLRRMEVTYGSE